MNRKQRNTIKLAAKQAIDATIMGGLKQHVNTKLKGVEKHIEDSLDISAHRMAGQLKQELHNGDLVVMKSEDYDVIIKEYQASIAEIDFISQNMKDSDLLHQKQLEAERELFKHRLEFERYISRRFYALIAITLGLIAGYWWSL